MAKVAILLPYQVMIEEVSPMLSSYHHLTPVAMEYIDTYAAPERARVFEAAGVELIIARGLQAESIRKTVRIPVVEIRVTTQEMGMVVVAMKRELGAAFPRIGLIGFGNMFGDISKYAELFGVEMVPYMVNSSEELVGAVESAVQDGCAAVIGGDSVCEEAGRRQLPHHNIPSGRESLQIALRTANNLGYGIDLLKVNSAEMNTMLEFTSTGIMQIDNNGVVKRVNRAALDLLGSRAQSLVGKKLSNYIRSFKQGILDHVLDGTQELETVAIDIDGLEAIINIVPIRLEGIIDGAILTIQEGEKIMEMDSQLRTLIFRRGLSAGSSFDDMRSESAAETEVIRRARRYAGYSEPILILAERGCPVRLYAGCIHSASAFGKNALVPCDCSAWTAEELDSLLFGSSQPRAEAQASLVQLASEGTLLLENIDQMSMETQSKLVSLINGVYVGNGGSRPSVIRVHVIASTSANILGLVKEGRFRNDLYFSLMGLTLELLPLRKQKENIRLRMTEEIGKLQKKYGRYVHLTKGALDFLEEYDWPGNMDEMRGLASRIVLISEKRTISEAFTRTQLAVISPDLETSSDRIVLYKDKEAVRIAEVLSECGGNRKKTAERLGISKTTLWRKMNQYGIGKDGSY